MDEIEVIAAKVVARVLACYNAEYIAKCVKNEPDSLLALVKRLEAALINSGRA